MCNLYTLAPWEAGQLFQHHRLIDQAWQASMAGRNDTVDVYPNYLAPVARVAEGERRVEVMRWGFPPPPFVNSKAPVTNVRNTASNYWKPWFKKEHRCIVPVSAFAEPDRNTSKPVVFRWFKRADGLPFFFAGIWRAWEGDRGTKKAPNVGKHLLYSFLTTSPNGIVAPLHDKAMPVMLMTASDVDRWLEGTPEEALELQRPAADSAIELMPPRDKAA